MHMGSMPGQAKSFQTGLPRRGQEGLHSLQCRGLLHFRTQCPNARGGQLASGDRTQSNPQVNVLSRNQQLAQQMEQHFQQA